MSRLKYSQLQMYQPGLIPRWEMGTLIFSYIYTDRLIFVGSKFWILIFLGGFRKIKILGVYYEDFVDILGVITKPDYFGGQFYASSKGQCTQWEFFFFFFGRGGGGGGLLKFQSFGGHA